MFQVCIVCVSVCVCVLSCILYSDHTGRTPMHFACESGSSGCLEMLIVQFPDAINSVDSNQVSLAVPFYCYFYMQTAYRTQHFTWQLNMITLGLLQCY